MTKLLTRHRPRLLAYACCGLLLSACATTNQTEDTLEERAMLRWDALLSGDVEAAYEFLSPGYRSSVTMLQYHRALLLSKVKWKDAKYIKDECEETICNVKISLGFYCLWGLTWCKIHG